MPYGTRFSYILSKKTKKGKGGSIAGLFPQEGHKGFRCVRPSNLLAIACSSSLYSSMHNGQRSIFIQYKNKFRKFTSITCWGFFATFWKTKLDHCVCTDCCIYIYHGMFFQQQQQHYYHYHHQHSLTKACCCYWPILLLCGVHIHRQIDSSSSSSSYMLWRFGYQSDPPRGFLSCVLRVVVRVRLLAHDDRDHSHHEEVGGAALSRQLLLPSDLELVVVVLSSKQYI